MTQHPTDDLRLRILGLGERSMHKSYYPDLQRQLDDLARFRRLLDRSREGILVIRAQDRQIVDANSAARTLFALDDTHPESWLDTIGAERLNLWLTLGQGDAARPHAPLIRLDNRYLELEAAEERMEDGSYLILMVRDVTEQQVTQEALRASDEKFRRVVESNLDGMVAIDCESRITLVNHAAAALFGYTREELLGQPLDVLIPSNLRDVHRGMVKHYWATRHGQRAMNRTLEFNAFHRDGHSFSLEVSLADASYGEHELLIATVRETTARRRQEEILRRFATIIEQAAEEIIMTDTEGVIQYVNPAFTRITGYTSQEVLGKTPRLLKSGEHDDAFYATLWSTIKNGHVWTGRFVNRCKDGHLIEEDAILTPILDEHGRITGFVSLKRDVSEQVRLSEQLRQAQKMEAIGRLAGGIAHDFNNLLTGITGYIDLAIMHSGGQSKMQALLQEAHQGSLRAANLTRQLLAFSRKQVIEPRDVELNRLILNVQLMLERIIGEDINLQTDLAPDSGYGYIDQGQIEQVLLNLAVNARDAMPQGGILRIKSYRTDLFEPHSLRGVMLPPGPYIRVDVCDNGTGMDADTLEHIFEPFFTTKAKDKGTGLGLATAFGILSQHKGGIDVSSAPGRGSCFSLFLPRLPSASVREESVPTVNEAIPIGHETILLVEDEPIVRDIVARMLGQLGYHLLLAENAQQALEQEAVWSEPIHMLVTDIVMPGMNGRELADEMRRRRPAIKVLLTSGYTDDAWLQSFNPTDDVAFLQKPYGMQSLAKKMRELFLVSSPSAAAAENVTAGQGAKNKVE